MYTQQDLNNVINYAKDNLDLANATLSEGFYYDSLPLCVIDAIYSISVKYKQVINVIERVTRKLHLNKYQQIHGQPADSYKISDFLNDLRPYMADNKFGAVRLYQNKGRTSSKSGILKAEALYQILNIFQDYGINDLASFTAHKTEEGDLLPEIEAAYKNVRGQHSGVSLSYLYMLAGDENFVKSDRWIKRFIKEATGIENMANTDVIAILREASQSLKQEYPNMTPRLLDHTIWAWIKDKEAEENDEE